MRALSEHVGSWSGTNGFRLLPGDAFHDAPMTAMVSSAAGGALTSIAYSWSHPDDGLQDGLLVVGQAEEPDAVVALWGDSWHQSTEPRILSGGIAGRRIAIGYEYAPGWRWEITVDATSAGVLVVQMDNVVPASAVDEGDAPGAYAAMLAELRQAPDPG